MIKKDKRIVLFVIVVILSTLSACSSPYIGMEVSSNQAFCNKVYGECSGVLGNFYISYSIYKDGDGYEIKGEAVPTEGTSNSWEIYSHAIFTLYLINNSVIVETVPIMAGTGGIDSKITFRRKFKSKGFTYSTIGYSMNVRG